ncbi:hypothetical protein [Celeribacter halophilus]|uniref:Uncharacterized protein n=1 Tax=Celeribacter halophilus TaxID=576117 RepID=A0A1I3XB57_9RHOB|nr:hypothetical protein [Celeribacter halophilus]PZX03781.1 hypothetical protein LX82_03758 [Celeribacter halophilus]SFK16793.1 hypothetical protein SAMN04488138_14615 [Celeribacter halophilus]
MPDTLPRAYPLQWPEGVPRRMIHEKHGPMITMAAAVASLKDLLGLWADEMGATLHGVVISSNVTLGQSMPHDPGVALYFRLDNVPHCLASDRYRRPEQNVRAIYDQIMEKRREGVL